MFLSLRSKNLNAKIKEINVLLKFSQMLHGTHRNGISFLATLEQAYRDRWLSRPQLSESSAHPLTLEEEERRPSLLHSPKEKSHMELGLEI